jgi:hypothetical protein
MAGSAGFFGFRPYNCSLALALDTGQARVRYINLLGHNKMYFGMRARKHLPQKSLPYHIQIKNKSGD